MIEGWLFAVILGEFLALVGILWAWANENLFIAFEEKIAERAKEIVRELHFRKDETK